MFDLFKLNLADTTNYGHFGKNYLPWEKTDIAKDRPHQHLLSPDQRQNGRVAECHHAGGIGAAKRRIETIRCIYKSH